MVGLDFWMWSQLLLYSRLPPSNQWTSPLVWLPLFLPGFTSRAMLVPWTSPGDFGREPKSPRTPAPTYDQRGMTVISPKGHVIQLISVGCAVTTCTEPYAASGLGLSLNSRLSTQPPTDLPTPKSPQMQHVQDHTHKPPLKTWSSSLVTNVSVTEPIIQLHKLETQRHPPPLSPPSLSNSSHLAHLPLKQPFTAPPPSGPNARA